ncbi:MAG: hypothetical protein Q9204_005592 [Flavoplaca sp. TL-2023a]
MNQGQFYAPQGDSDYKQLFDAAHSSDNNRLAAALTLPINVDALQPGTQCARAALHIVASLGNVEAIWLLLESGADVKIPDSAGDFALNYAASALHEPAVKALIEAGAPLGTRSGSSRHNALYSTLRDKDVIGWREIRIVEIFLDGGADIEGYLEIWGSTLISTAAKLGNLDLVRLLVERGETLPDDLLCGVKDCATARYLLDRGARIVKDSDPDVSAIITAVATHNTSMLSLLLSYADDADIRTSYEALHFAAMYGYLDAVEVLLNHGIDVNTHLPVSDYEETPLASACRGTKPNSETVKRLLERGADVNFRDTSGSTALHCAAASGDPDTIQLLLRNGAETSARESNGGTALSTAAYAMCHSRVPYPFDEDAFAKDEPLRCFRMILDATVDINIQGRHGYTPLHALACGSLVPWAARGRLEAARLLVVRGADLTIKGHKSNTAAELFTKNDQHGFLREKASGSDPYRYCYSMLLSSGGS